MNVLKRTHLGIAVLGIITTAASLFGICIGPTVSVTTSQGSAGASLTVTGQYFTDGCHDVCINGKCPPTFPAKGVKILFVQDKLTEEVGRVDANDRFEISATVKVPANAQVGPAQFLAETLYENSNLRTSPVSFTVTAKR